MHPILFEIPRIDLGSWVIGPIPIRMYGLMIGIGFLLGITLGVAPGEKGRHRSRAHPRHGRLSPACGHRRFAAALCADHASRNSAATRSMSLRSGRAGSCSTAACSPPFPSGIWYVRKHNLPVWKTADIMAPSIALAHAFGRLGCFFAGLLLRRALQRPGLHHLHRPPLAGAAGRSALSRPS